MKIFLTTNQAAELVGLTPRHFHRKYVETGLVKAVIFSQTKNRDGISGRIRRQMFLRVDVEKLK